MALEEPLEELQTGSSHVAFALLFFGICHSDEEGDLFLQLLESIEAAECTMLGSLEDGTMIS
jgi:hypothetical protein